MLKDPLDSVFWDSEENKTFRQEIASLLAPYIELTHSGQVNFTKRYFDLNVSGKVYAYLLGRWVLHVKDIRPEGATADEIARDVDMKDGSVRPTLAALMKTGAVRRMKGDGNTEYRAIPGHAWKVKFRKWTR